MEMLREEDDDDEESAMVEELRKVIACGGCTEILSPASGLRLLLSLPLGNESFESFEPNTPST